MYCCCCSLLPVSLNKAGVKMGREKMKQRRNRSQVKKRSEARYQQEGNSLSARSSIFSTWVKLGLVVIVSTVIVVICLVGTQNFSQSKDDVTENKVMQTEEITTKNLSDERNAPKGTANKPPTKTVDVKGFKSTIHNILQPMPITYDGRNIQFVEIKHEHKESSVRVYIADNFLTERECDGLTAAHLSHVREASKKQPLVCFEGVQTMNKYLKDINFRYTGSKSDFTPGTLCVNESFSKSLSKRLHYSLSTAFYRGDSKFSEIFEEQVEKATGLSKVHGGKFQITSYNANVGYKTHTDCTEDDEIRDRFATILVYLQDVKEGGETKFPVLGISVKPVKGRLLVWNNMRPDGSCDPTSIHNAAKVIAGRKVIIQRWYYYKNFPTLGRAHPEPALPKRQQYQPRISCDEYDQGSCRWYDEWGYDHLVDYKLVQHSLS